MCRSRATRAASARSTIARSQWPWARWTRPRSLLFSARPAATSPPSAPADRCTSSAWTGATLTSCWPAGGEAYGELKNVCVWIKDNAGMGSLYRSQHELVLVFKQRGGSHRNNVQLGQFGRNRSNVWRYPGVNSFARSTAEGNLLALHPTVKPVGMVADAILDCTARGEIVLDAFLGSGTTLIAAERTGRRCYGLELDPAYVDRAIRRWQALTGGSARHAASGRSFDDLAREVEAANAV